MTITFEHDYQQKIMRQGFTEPWHLATGTDVQTWRQAWMQALATWHSPYKVLVDCTNLSVGDDAETVQALQMMLRFFNGFFLRKAVGFGRRADSGHDRLPFPVFATIDEAATELGIRAPRSGEVSDLRSAIHLQNHFRQHVIELSFAVPTTLASPEDIQILRSKLQNNLMQWHSKWSLIVDCTNLEVAASAVPALEQMLKVLRGFFMKKVVGYGRRAAAGDYPFEVFMARHRAAAALEAEGAFSGDDAQCQSKKSRAD